MIPNLAVYLVSLKSLTSLNFTYGICNSQQMYSFSWKRVDVASLLQFGSGLPECNTGGGERSGMEEREKERERERERELLTIQHSVNRGGLYRSGVGQIAVDRLSHCWRQTSLSA